jgi:hypothetical protein
LLLARLLRAWWRSRATAARMLRIGVESFGRVLAPLLVVGLLAWRAWCWSCTASTSTCCGGAAAVLVAGGDPHYLLPAAARVRAPRPAGRRLLTFEKIFALLVWAAVALYITGKWPDVFDFLDSTDAAAR